MSKTIRHNRNGKSYQDKDSAGRGYHTDIKNSCGCIKRKRENKMYGTFGKRCTRYANGYPYERDAQSDRMKGYKHVESKLLRRGLQREAEQLINDELNDIE